MKELIFGEGQMASQGFLLFLHIGLRVPSTLVGLAVCFFSVLVWLSMM